MSSDSDDALSWDGDDAEQVTRPELPRGWKAVGKGSADVVEEPESARTDAVAEAPERGESAGNPETEEPAEAEEEPAGLSTAMLLLLGVVGGVYLLYTIGWAVGGMRLKPLANLIVADAMFVPWYVLAIAAPAIWFLATWALTRRRAAWIRVCVLLLGVVLLVPWPFVTVGVIGA